MENIFSHPEYLRWRKLRESEDARFLAITLPQILMRTPYKEEYDSLSGLTFRENCRNPSGEDYLWGNAAFAYGTVLIREFGNTNWLGHTKGTPQDILGGGLVTYFEPMQVTSANNDVHHILGSLLITDALEKDLNDQGILALCPCYGTEFSAFISNPSLQKPKKYDDKSSTANARISAMLPQIFCASRFAHFIKLLVRDKIGSYITSKDCEAFLQKWLDNYTSGRDDLNWEMRARYPLRDVRVQVRELPGSAGKFSCVVYLKPHYTADHLIAKLKINHRIATGCRLTLPRINRNLPVIVDKHRCKSTSKTNSSQENKPGKQGLSRQ